jgi:hypothetical protein
MRLTLAAVLASGAVASATLLGGGGGDRSGDFGALPASAKVSSDLRVHGRIKGLYPGARKRLRVRVRNTYPRHARVRLVRTSVRSAGPDCSRANLHVRGNPRTRWIPAHSKILIRLRVRMSASAPDACQGATWPLRYRVRVERR